MFLTIYFFAKVRIVILITKNIHIKKYYFIFLTNKYLFQFYKHLKNNNIKNNLIL